MTTLGTLGTLVMINAPSGSLEVVTGSVIGFGTVGSYCTNMSWSWSKKGLMNLGFSLFCRMNTSEGSVPSDVGTLNCCTWVNNNSF